MNFSDRLNFFIDQKFKRKKEFIDKFLSYNPISKRTKSPLKDKVVYAYIDGTRAPEAEHYPIIAKVLNVTLEELMGIETSVQVNKNYIELPMIYAGAGAEAFAVDKAETISYPMELIPPQIALDENLLIMKVVGNSMEPLYYENDVVFIDMVNDREFVPVNGTYLVRYGETVQIKDVEFLGNGEIMLFSRNSPAVIKPKELGLDWEIVGKPYVNFHPTIGSKLKIKG